MKTPKRQPVDDFSNVSGAADMMKTPRHADDELFEEEVQELVDSIDSVLQEDLEDDEKEGQASKILQLPISCKMMKNLLRKKEIAY